LRWLGILCSFFCFGALHNCLGAQSKAADDVFTLSVVLPTKARDVQVRYSFTGDFGTRVSSVANPTDDNKIVIHRGAEDKPAKGLKLIAYAPGCQFVTISVDDLAGSDRQGVFQCTPLNTVLFKGHANVSAISSKALEVQVLYGCDWASQFFAGQETAISPFSLGRAEISFDGSFAIDLPDFSADPLWSSLSSHASLLFYALDSKNGQPLAELTASNIQSKKGTVKVAPVYSEVEFSIQPQTPGRSSN
jgi:hypothetical protein